MSTCPDFDFEAFARAVGREIRTACDEVRAECGLAPSAARLGVARPARPRTMSLPLSHVTKFLSNGKRTIRGVASTDSLDRQGDRVDPQGGKWRLPLPLLLGHDSMAIIGAVHAAKVTGRGIEIEAELAEGVARADEVWSLIELGGLSSYSIGFIGERGDPISTGVHWREWTLLEISVVPIPANADARIERANKSTGGIKLVSRPGRGSVPLVTRGRP